MIEAADRLGTPIWFDLMTDAPGQARQFFGQLLGWRYVLGDSDSGDYAIATLAGRPVAGIGQKPAGAPYPNVWTVYFGVADADETAEKAKSLGASLLSPPLTLRDAGRYAVLSDPTGAPFALWQPLRRQGVQAFGEPGAVAWCEAATREAESACTFYARLFALDPRRLEGPGLTYFTLHKGQRTVGGVLQMHERWPQQAPAHWRTYLAVSDVDAVARRVVALGGQVPHAPFDTPFGRTVDITAPDGSTVTLVKPAQP